MPFLEVESYGIPAVAAFETLLEGLLERAESAKPSRSIEPALKRSDFDDLLGEVPLLFADSEAKLTDTAESRKKVRQYAIVETAVRDVFSKLISTTPIDSPDFVRVWNLFDILSILSDSEECDPTMLFWLVEELLDSQTIAGCRRVFDFLESRRENITAQHFNSIKLVILRSCNDLLRRLSRAEDTPFCGRVFIFLFQVFPLGDKSSVNLRGEYHVENVTTFDETAGKDSETPDKMDVDAEPEPTKDAAGTKPPTKSDSTKEPALKPDVLYPIFWSLQASFSQPKRLFDPGNFAHFKFGLEATLAAFQQNKNDHGSQSAKPADEASRGGKRKRDETDDELADAYNPKYLTSRDLFELETSDLTFRRHFLVQAVIIIEFLMSLSAKSKEKLATTSTQNKSVMYSDQLLGEDDLKWVTNMRGEIFDYIRTKNSDGAYFLRMVETILSRDKNWVRWKVESCPSIEFPAVSATDFAEAQEQARRAFSNKRLRPAPMGSLSLDFLDDGDEESAMAKFKSPERYLLPELASFKTPIAEEELEIDMPSSDKSKANAIERKASKTWRALRIASRFKLAAFDHIEDDDKIDSIFNDDSNLPQAAADPENLPGDTCLVVLSGPRGVGKSTLIKLLMERNPEVFGEVLQHTTRPQDSPERYQVVDAKTFDVMRDGDKFLEASEVDGFMYGTSNKLVEDVGASGKVPVMQMHRASVQAAKEMEYSARYVFVQPHSLEVLEARLKQSGVGDEELQGVLASAKEDQEHADSGGFDKVIVNKDLKEACKSLEDFIYGVTSEPDSEPKLANGTSEEGKPLADVEMAETTNEAAPKEINGVPAADAGQ